MNPQNKLTTEQFVAKAKAIHGDKYDYSKVDYANNHTKVCIICHEHGLFWQTPKEHLKGSGCIQCGRERMRFKQTLSQEEFIQKAMSVHGDKYDYSKVEYVNATTPVSIICPRHGVFKQKAYGHIWGYGCPHCANESKRKLVYGVGIKDITCSKPKYYSLWSAVLRRCYWEASFKKNPTYRGCSVCDEWLTLSNFKKWFESPENGYRENYQLDKDLIVKGNKVYSPSTCCFLPIELNSLLTSRRNFRGKYPIGVSKKNNKYQVSLSTEENRYKYLGVYDTPEEAFQVYKQAKEKHIKNLAERYFQEGKITERVYHALMKYEIEITD